MRRVAMRTVTFVSGNVTTVQGRLKIIDTFMEVGVGPARYRDLNSDIPACISMFSYTGGHEPIKPVTDAIP